MVRVLSVLLTFGMVTGTLTYAMEDSSIIRKAMSQKNFEEVDKDEEEGNDESPSDNVDLDEAQRSVSKPSSDEILALLGKILNGDLEGLVLPAADTVENKKLVADLITAVASAAGKVCVADNEGKLVFEDRAAGVLEVTPPVLTSNPKEPGFQGWKNRRIKGFKEGTKKISESVKSINIRNPFKKDSQSTELAANPQPQEDANSNQTVVGDKE